jgi:selenophosphate synthase
LKTADSFTDWGPAAVAQKQLLTDAQTSGGLLLCVAPKRLEQVLALLAKSQTPSAAVIGRIERSRESRIRVIS